MVAASMGAQCAGHGGVDQLGVVVWHVSEYLRSVTNQTDLIYHITSVRFRHMTVSIYAGLTDMPHYRMYFLDDNNKIIDVTYARPKFNSESATI
jgi:hypothetical protein